VPSSGLVVSQLDDGGEVEQGVYGLAGGLDARPEVLPEVDVEGRRDIQVARELRGLVDRRACGIFYEQYAPEVDKRGPGQELLGDVFGGDQLVSGRVRAVEGEGPVAVFPDLHERQRGVEITARRGDFFYNVLFESHEYYDPPRPGVHVAVHVFKSSKKTPASCGLEEKAALAEFSHYGGKEVGEDLEAFPLPGRARGARVTGYPDRGASQEQISTY
jgi:hypothetical protein